MVRNCRIMNIIYDTQSTINENINLKLNGLRLRSEASEGLKNLNGKWIQICMRSFRPFSGSPGLRAGPGAADFLHARHPIPQSRSAPAGGRESAPAVMAMVVAGRWQIREARQHVCSVGAGRGTPAAGTAEGGKCGCCYPNRVVGLPEKGACCGYGRSAVLARKNEGSPERLPSPSKINP